MATFAFSGGVVSLPAYGQRSKVRFVGTWAAGDTWSMAFTSTLTGDFTIGVGNVSGANALAGFKLRDRMYVALGGSFAFSALDNLYGWEEQDPGAGVVNFTSQFGSQDDVIAFATMQGRLAVFGKYSIQLWQTDADPANFALQQTLDNSGTLASLSVESIGDSDVLYLDLTGIRSLRSKELTQNAEVIDVGTPVDELVKPKVMTYTTAPCAIVEPTQKQYWLFLDDTIFVLSKFSSSKVTAWSTFRPRIIRPYVYADDQLYQDVTGTPTVLYQSPLVIGRTYYWTKGANDVSFTCDADVLIASGSFVATATSATQVGNVIGNRVTSTLRDMTGTLDVKPIKFVIYNNIVYFLASNGVLYKYGTGTDSTSYDETQPVVELPYNDLGDPTMDKQALSMDVAIAGQWAIEVGMDPISGTLVEVLNQGSAVTPNMNADSTFDIGKVPVNAHGSHFKFKATGAAVAKAAKLGKISFIYKKA